MLYMIPLDAVVYCDMDGVLVDFETAVVGLINRLLDCEPLVKTKMSKSYFKALCKVRTELGLGWRVQDRNDLNIQSVREFMMSAIGANPGEVFASMPPFRDGVEQLWPFLTSSGHTVNILSAPIRERIGSQMSSEEGKVHWVKEWLDTICPPNEIIITPADQKTVYAVVDGVPNVLVDDKASTVSAWNDIGGIGILHTPGNSDATIRTLRQMMF